MKTHRLPTKALVIVVVIGVAMLVWRAVKWVWHKVYWPS